jgi:predicted RND superfamily exporter protein
MASGGAPVVNNSLAVWFVEDDPARVAYESFQDLFGNDEVLVLSVGTVGVPLDRATLDLVAATAERMRTVKGVASVTGPEDAAAGPLARLLLDDDRSIALLVARFEVMEDADARRHGILVSLRDAAGDLSGAGAELHWAGIGLVYDELNEVSFQETPLLTGGSFVIVGLVLYAVVGSAMPVLVALASVVASIMILMGIFTLAGYELNMVTAVLPTLLLVVGTANAVHIFGRLRGVPPGARDEALRDVLKPCLFTALTTAAGFASLATARMAVIRDLGIFAALGVLVAFAATFVFVGAFASSSRFRVRGARRSWMAGPLGAIAGLVVRRPRSILAGAAVVVALAVWGAASVVADTYSIEFFRAGDPVRVDNEAIEAGYGWYLPLEFAVRSGRPDGALDPGLIEDVSAWQRRVEASGLAQWSLSIADFGMGAPEAPGAPALDPVAARILDREREALRVTYGVPMESARGWAARIDSIRKRGEEVLPADVELTMGGYLPLYVRMMDYIVDTQVRSFAAALFLVFAVMAIFLRSPRAVLLSVFPNLLPILTVFGLMGALGIRLDIATVTVAAIAMGIVVDDTVHLLYRFREGLARSGDPATSVRRALEEAGPALIGTSVVLAASFAVLGFASVLSIALFGLLTAATIVCALAADLVVLPALLIVFFTPRPPIVGDET